MYKVYLAGPITGLNYKGATDWRNYAKDELAKVGVTGLSPMRAKDYLKDVEKFPADGDAYAKISPMSSNRGITTRDRFDCTRCDVVLVNLLGATSLSAGTTMEIAWADLKRIPIVCAMEPKGNPHEHGMILESIGFRVTSLDEALYVTKCVLGV